MRAILFSLICCTLFQACKKDSTSNTNCNACNIIGTYSGSFHQTAGCYACIPYLDSTFSGLFTVDTLNTDSIVITRSYDNYRWIFAYADSGYYSQSGCCTVIQSFDLRKLDSLTFYYNNGGSGGYFREEFYGKK